MRRTLVALAMMALAVPVVAAPQPLSRYQSIIDRQMFGMPPPGFDPDKNPNEVKGGKGAEKELTQEQEKLQSAIHFSMINITPSGETAVGFTDNSDSRHPVHYYLKVGQKSSSGWEVLEADPVKAWMRIRKGDVELPLELGSSSGDKGKDSAAKASSPTILPAPASAPAANGARPIPRRNMLLGGSNSLRSRRQQREAEAAERLKRAEEERARQAEERERQKEEIQEMREEMQRQREEREAERQAEEERRRQDEERRLEEERRREENQNLDDGNQNQGQEE